MPLQQQYKPEINTGNSDYNYDNYKSQVVASKIYTDLHSSFIHPITNNVIVSTDLDAIANSIKNIVLTPRGSRPFFPEFGTSIPYLLFEPGGWPIAYQIESEIIETLERFEPRINNLNIEVTFNPDVRPYTYEIKISYSPYFGGTAITSFTLNQIR